MIKKNKLLMICKEHSSVPLSYISKNLQKRFEVEAIFFMPHEGYNNSIFIRHFKKENPNIKIITTNEYFLKSFFSDYEFKSYIKKIEKEYTFFKTLNMQLQSSQFFFTYNHFREYYHKLSYDDHLKFLVIAYKYFHQLLKINNYKIIIDIDNSEIYRIILLELSNKFKIPYKQLYDTRYKDYYLLNSFLSIKNDIKFIKSYNSLKLNKNQISEINKEIKSFIKKRRITPNRYNTLIASSQFSLVRDSFNLVNDTFKFFLSFFDKQFFFNLKKNPFFSIGYKRYLYSLKSFYRKFILTYNYNFKTVNSEKYVLVPLHFIPESTTFVVSKYFINELFILETLAKVIPSNYRIVVKEHFSMIGERPLSFYKKIQKIPNLVFVSPYTNNKELISKSQCVFTISGSTAFEAALHNIPSLLFGNAVYDLIDTYIFKTNNLEDVEFFIKNLQSIRANTNYINVIKYVYLVKLYGKSLDINLLSNIYADKESLDFKKSSKNLFDLFNINI